MIGGSMLPIEADVEMFEPKLTCRLEMLGRRSIEPDRPGRVG